jgi:hypothetical protein
VTGAPVAGHHASVNVEVNVEVEVEVEVERIGYVGPRPGACEGPA